MTPQKKQIAFIGLGAMGYPMAGHLAQAGHAVTVFNRTHARAEAWRREFGGAVASTPAEAAAKKDAVMICVGNDNDVLSVTTSDTGVLKTLSAGALLIDHTTTSEALAVSLSDTARQTGVGFLDAPVSGGQIGAEKGALTVMVGATEPDYQNAVALIGCYAKCVRHMGAPGTGQLTKMVNQICIAGLVQGLAEGIHFAERVGLDASRVIEVIAQGAAQSWQMDNRASTMIAGKFDFGFAVDWMRKDLGIVIDAARAANINVPVTELVDGFYADVQALGGNRWDTSSRIQRLRAQGKDT